MIIERQQILNELAGLEWGHETVKCKRVAYPVMDFITICVDHWTSEHIAEALGCSKVPAMTAYNKYFKETLGEYKGPIGSRFVSLLGYRRCSNCYNVQDLEQFIPIKAGGYESNCRTCNAARCKSYNEENRDLLNERAKEWQKANPEKARASTAKWEAANPEKARENTANWKSANPHKNKEYASKRRAAKLQRTPPWADSVAISEIYESCPSGYEVDHIVPLQGKLVSGLHVHNNLQHLPADANRAKSNKWEI